MARGDIVLLESNTLGTRGSRLYNVAAGTPIYAGEPVQVMALGNGAAGAGATVVVPALTSTPDQTAHLYVGIAQTDSTNTTSAAGTVNVVPIHSGHTWIINPD